MSRDTRPGGDLTAAIATITFSRETHRQWRDWLLEHPDDPRSDALGDADYHARAVEEYDNVLACLGSAAPLDDLAARIEAAHHPSHSGHFRRGMQNAARIVREATQ